MIYFYLGRKHSDSRERKEKKEEEQKAQDRR